MGDAAGYWELAENLAQGDDFAIHTPPRYALRMPGFPCLLAASITAFGKSLLAARLMLAVVGTFCCWLVYRLGVQLFDVPTGVIACAMAALQPVFVGFSVTILSETTFAATLTLSLLAGSRLSELFRGTGGGMSSGSVTKWAFLTGAAIALGCYVRPSWILAGPAFGSLLLVFKEQRWQAALATICILIGTIVVLLPWGIRNQRVTGHFTLTTFWMGPSLYDGLNPDATGESDMTFFDRDRLSEEMSEFEVDQHYRKLALEFVRQNPGRTMQLALIKLSRFWKPWPNAEQFQSISARLAVGAVFIPVLVLAIAGTWASRREIWPLAICWGPVFYFSVIHMVFVGSLRYRLPAEYPLLVVAAYGLRVLWSYRTRPGR